MSELGARVTPETKAAFSALAEKRGLSASELLRQMVANVLEQTLPADPSQRPFAGHRGGTTRRLALRLRGDEAGRILAHAEPAGNATP